MAEQKLKTRLQNKRGTSTEWAAATNFIPLEGEICFYSDLNKIKIGNGSDKINDLEFVQAYHIILTASTTNSYEITKEQYNGLIGDYNSFIVIGSKIYRKETSGPAPTFKYQYDTLVEEYLLRFASGGYKLIKTNGYTVGTTNTSQTISSPKTFTSSIGIDSSSSSAQGTLNVKIDSRNEGTPFSVTASNLSDGNVFGIKACAYLQTEKPGVLIGSSSVACDVRLGGDADSNAGTAGQVLTSQGPGATPTWADPKPYHIILTEASNNKYTLTSTQSEGLINDYNSYIVIQNSSGTTSTVYNRVLASAGGYFFKAIGESKTSKTFLLNDNTLSPFTSGNYTAEETSNKVSSIIDSNETSTTLYPSVKAVADYVGSQVPGKDALEYNSYYGMSSNPTLTSQVTLGLSYFNRTPIVGENFLLWWDNYATKITYLCLCKVSSIAGTNVICNVSTFTKTTGKDGKDGASTLDEYTDLYLPDIDKNYGITYSNGVASIDGTATFDGVSQAKMALNIVLPIKGGNGIVVDADEDAKSIEVRAADTLTLAEDQSLTVEKTDGTVLFTIDQDTINFDPASDQNFYFKVNGQHAISSVPNQVTSDMAIGDGGDFISWIYVAPYYEITGVPTSATSGTLPNDDGWAFLRNYALQKDIGLVFNKERYRLMDIEHTTGTMVWSHTGYENNRLIVKTITITLSTRAWKLTTIKPPLQVIQGVIVTQSEHTFYAPPVPWTRDDVTWYEYSSTFTEGIPTNIVYQKDDDIILVTSINVDQHNNLFNCTEVNLTTGAVSTVPHPQEYMLDEILIGDIDGVVV